MMSSAQRTIGTRLDSKPVVRAIFGWDANWHRVSLGNDVPVLPKGGRGT